MNKVTVGPGTVAGFGFSGAAFVAAVLAFIYGDHSQQNLTVIAGGVILGLTILGRQWQAVNATRADALVKSTVVVNALDPEDVATIAALVERIAPPTDAPPRDPPIPGLEVPGGSVPT